MNAYPPQIEQAIYDGRDKLAPNATQPKHGKFAHSIARKTSVSLHPQKGRMAQAKSNNWVMGVYAF